MNKKERVFASGYKGFNPDFTCRGKKYTTNTIFEESGGEICGKGVMHFCKDPADVLSYYPPVSRNGELNKFAKVEALAECQDADDDKSATTKLRICEELSLEELLAAEIRVAKQDTTTEDCEPSYTTGDYAHSCTTGTNACSCTTGYRAHSCTAGYSACSYTTGVYAYSCTTGDFSHSITTGDDSHSCCAGYKAHACTTGDFAHAYTSGMYACSCTTGDSAYSCSVGTFAISCTNGPYSHAYAAGTCAKATTHGREAIATALGVHGRAKATLGGWIVLCEYGEKDGHIVDIKSAKVDGKVILPDTFYELINGEFVAVD